MAAWAIAAQTAWAKERDDLLSAQIRDSAHRKLFDFIGVIAKLTHLAITWPTKKPTHEASSMIVVDMETTLGLLTLSANLETDWASVIQRLSHL